MEFTPDQQADNFLRSLGKLDGIDLPGEPGLLDPSQVTELFG